MTIMIIAVATVPVFALNMSVPGYTVETYATYSEGRPRHMTFDANGNLYVAHDGTGSIWKITPSGTATQFASGFTSPTSIEWGGGTAFGDYLYVGEARITKVDLNGNKTPFASQTCNGSLTIDKVGNYGGYLYVGTGCYDDIKRINTSGNITTFTSWPGQATGAPYGIDFDSGTAYGGLMYVGCEFPEYDADISGLFTLDTSGTPTRFCSNLAQAWALHFDRIGLFGGQLLVIGRAVFGGPVCIYTVNTDGIAAEIATFTMPGINVLGLTFGPDGALYTTEYSPQDELVAIYRITPESTNTPPVADAGPDQTLYAWIDEIAEVNLDGSASYDDDGDELTYLWTWSIDANVYDTNTAQPIIELPIGLHTISLIVNDGSLDSAPDEVNITVAGPLEVNMCVIPNVLNCRCSRTSRIITILHMPDYITEDQIDTNEPLLLYPGEIEADSIRVLTNPRTQSVIICAAFDKDELLDDINDSGQIELMAVGRLITGQYFFGTGNITVICPGRWQWRWPWHHRPCRPCKPRWRPPCNPRGRSCGKPCGTGR